MPQSEPSSERLRRLTRLNLRGEYQQILKEYRAAVDNFEISELLIYAHAAYHAGAHGVLRSVLPALRKELGENSEVVHLRMRYVTATNDRAEGVALAESLTPENLGPVDGVLVQFCNLLARQQAWVALQRVLRVCNADDGRGIHQGLLGPRALLRLRRRDYVNAFLDAESAVDKSPKRHIRNRRWLFARVAEACGDYESAVIAYAALIGKRQMPARIVYRVGWVGLRSGRLRVAEDMLGRARQAGAGGSGFDKLEGYVAAAREAFDVAEAAFARVLERWPDDDEALIGWFDSRAKQVSAPDALSDLDALLQRHDTPELNVRRIVLLRQLGNQEQAEHERRELVSRFPDADIGGLLSRTEEALAGAVQGSSGGQAPSADRSDPEIVDAAEVPREWPEAFRPQWTNEELRSAIGLRQIVAIQVRVVVALLMREVKTRYSRRKLGYLWAFFEPALHAGVLFMLWSFRGRTGFDGMPLLVFLISGLVPFFLFSQTWTRVGSAVQQNKPLLAHRHVTPYDAILARTILELLTRVAVFAVLMTGLALYGYEIELIKPISLWSTLILLSLTGVGFGLITQALTPIFASIQSITQAIMRLLYLTSGVIFPLSILPRSVQEIALYNPILHLIQFARYAFLHLDPITGVNYAYPAVFAIGLLLLGLLMTAAMRRQILES